MASEQRNKGGRPTKMTPRTLGKLREAFLLGASDEETCLLADIHPDTLYAYQKEHPEFSEQKRTLKLNPVLKARRTIFKDLDNPRTAMWLLERKRPEEFSPRYKVEQEDPDRRSTQLTPEKAESIKRALQFARRCQPTPFQA